MKDIRVLHCINGVGSGGAEKDIVTWYSRLCKQNVKFDFLIRTNDTFYKKEINKMGGSVYITDTFHKHPIKNAIQTFKFIKEHANYYDAVHVHGNTLFYIIPLIAAKRYGIKIRIFHAHNTQAANIISGTLHIINKKIVKKYMNKFIACSEKSAEFFGVDNPILIKNMIDLNKFYVSTDKDKLRKKLYFDSSDIIFTNVGRLSKVKNQSFLLDVFRYLRNKIPNAKLILIGVGPMEQQLKDKVKELGLEKNVIFTGQINNVQEYMNITDVLIFPSLYEGIPLTLLEAQACRVKTICSTNIDMETKITNYLFLKKLSDGPKEWANEVIDLLDKDIEEDVEKSFKDAGYDLDDSVNKLYKVYSGEI